MLWLRNLVKMGSFGMIPNEVFVPEVTQTMDQRWTG